MTQASSPVPDNRLLLRPSPRMWKARQVSLLLTGLPLALAATIPSWLLLGQRAGIAALLAVALVLAVAWCVLRGRFRSWGYLERADDLIVRHGLLFRQVTVVPYGRMQFIDITAGPVDRFFGLATVQLHTAAAASDARIPGLTQEVADGLRDRLAALGESQATGL